MVTPTTDRGLGRSSIWARRPAASDSRRDPIAAYGLHLDESAATSRLGRRSASQSRARQCIQAGQPLEHHDVPGGPLQASVGEKIRRPRVPLRTRLAATAARFSARGRAAAHRRRRLIAQAAPNQSMVRSSSTRRRLPPAPITSARAPSSWRADLFAAVFAVAERGEDARAGPIEHFGKRRDDINGGAGPTPSTSATAGTTKRSTASR